MVPADSNISAALGRACRIASVLRPPAYALARPGRPPSVPRIRTPRPRFRRPGRSSLPHVGRTSPRNGFDCISAGRDKERRILCHHPQNRVTNRVKTTAMPWTDAFQQPGRGSNSQVLITSPGCVFQKSDKDFDLPARSRTPILGLGSLAPPGRPPAVTKVHSW